jgi:atypical dual specificity phosphatase
VPFTHAQLHAAGDALARPHEHCYWLLPGRVLAGEHPGARGGEAGLAQRLRAMQACGVGCFIDLTLPDEGLPPYTPHAARRLAFPITDFGLPRPAAMRATLAAMAMAQAGGSVVYLHCRAGVGRTGTVAGCWLVEQGLAPSDAIALLQRKFAAADQSRGGRLTPETDAQRAFVAAWRARARGSDASA